MMMSSLALYPNEEEYLEYWSFYDQPLNDAAEDVFQLAFDGHLQPTQPWKSAAHPEQRLHRLYGPSSRSSEAEPACLLLATQATTPSLTHQGLKLQASRPEQNQYYRLT